MADSDCLFTKSCINGKCQGYMMNEVCDASGILGGCGVGLYCGWNGTMLTCMDDMIKGMTCNSSESCSPGLACINDKCQKAFSQLKGQSCMDQLSCRTGLVCNNTVPDSTQWKCVATLGSLVSCSSSSDCVDGMCVCSEFTGGSYCLGDGYPYDPCTTQLQALVSCLGENNCLEATDTPQSCSYTYCFDEFIQFSQCGNVIQAPFFGGCLYNKYE